MPEQQRKKLLYGNVTKTYKKAPPKLESIVELINLYDYIEFIARTHAFNTLNDHKSSIWQNPSRRLINPAKNKLGKVSKLIIDKINKKLISELHFNK